MSQSRSPFIGTSEPLLADQTSYSAALSGAALSDAGEHHSATASCERQVAIQGSMVSYRQWGEGPRVVVCLHGISSGAASWEDTAALLTDTARIIAWDAPGYGDSTPLPQARPLALNYAQQLSLFLQALQIKQCVLVGHSLGAMMAVAYTSLKQAVANELVLISPALGYGGDGPARPPEVVREGRLAALRDKGIHGIAQALPHRLLSAGATEAQRQRVTRIAGQLHEAGYRQAVEMLCGDSIYNYPKPTLATHVYCGDSDVVTPPAQSETYAGDLQAPFGLIHDAGHACYIEQPSRVAALIRDHLQRASGPQGAGA